MKSNISLLEFDSFLEKSSSEIRLALKSLPSYFGGKRKMFERILSHFSEGSVIDPMGGAMNIPLASKLSGRVSHANDRSYMSYIGAKALVENSSYKIDLGVLKDFVYERTGESFVVDNFGNRDLPKSHHLPSELMCYVDNIRGHVNDLSEEERWPYLQLLVKFLTVLAPYGLFVYPGLCRKYYEGTYPRSNQKIIDKWEMNIKDPIPLLERLSSQINEAIHEGEGYAYNMDVFDFLGSISGNVLYLDPPYAGAGRTYEVNYRDLNKMMVCDMNYVIPTSIFNDMDREREALKSLFVYGLDYDVTVFSYWSYAHGDEWFDEIYDEVGLVSEKISLDYFYSLATTAKDRTKGGHEILHILKKL
jgi:hypothetical protein